MHIAADFANTTAGWIVGLIVPSLLVILAGIVGYLFKSIKTRFEKLDTKIDKIVDSQTLNNTSLAIIMNDAPRLHGEIESLDARVQSLEISRAELTTSLKSHLDWHERRAERQERLASN